jgi:cell division protein FtsN
MSRLDYITIAIVAACILAIIFLAYKMTDLFNSDKAKDKIETVTDSVEVEDDSVYDYEIDEAVDSTGAASADKVAQPAPATKTTTKTPATTPATTPSVKDKTSNESSSISQEEDKEAETPATNEARPTYSSAGRFMVLGGSFTLKSHAEAEARRLRKLGYENANVEIFDRGKYAVVLIDRFDNMAEAEQLVKKLKADNVKCYVKMK